MKIGARIMAKRRTKKRWRNDIWWRDLTFWAQGIGGFGRVDGEGNAAALRDTFGGLLSGVDARFGMVRAGFMAGYTHSNVNVDARASSGTIDTAQLGAYAAASFGSFNLRTGAAGTVNAIDTSRSIAFPGFSDSTHAHFNGYTGQALGELGYGMAFGHVAVEPFAGLAYARVSTGAFLESGGLAALSGSSNAENIGYSSLGLRAATVRMLRSGTALIPHGSLQWQHAFGDVVPAAAVTLQSTGAAFSTAGLPIASNAALSSKAGSIGASPRRRSSASPIRASSPSTPRPTRRRPASRGSSEDRASEDLDRIRDFLGLSLNPFELVDATRELYTVTAFGSVTLQYRVALSAAHLS
jgi:outer membrane autotransporter protein